jgi:acetate---CoA ligase (ADP-forming) subunit beta
MIECLKQDVKMKEAQAIIEKARKEGRTNLSEYESKTLLRHYGMPVAREVLANDHEGFLKAVDEIGFPLVIKGCAPSLAHKTEQGLVRVDIRNREEADAVFEDLLARMDGLSRSLLVQEMVKGTRELVVGMTRDPQFGPCVMFGLGGIYTEILRDVSFRVAPLEKRDALQMTQEIRGRKILESVRGMPPADVESLCEILITMGQIGLEHEAIKEIDVNPLILSGSKPVAVDALVVLGGPSPLS